MSSSDSDNENKFFGDQAFVDLGDSALVVISNQSVTIPVTVTVQKKGPVKIDFTGVFEYTGDTNILINVFRGAKSLTDGPQVLYKLSGTQNVMCGDYVPMINNLSFKMVDKRVRRGIYEYRVVLTNKSKLNFPLNVKSYSVVIAPGKIYTSQDIPAISNQPALKVKANSQVDIKLLTKVCSKDRVKLELDLGLILFDFLNDQVKIDILRGKVSLTKGSQKFIGVNPAAVSGVSLTTTLSTAVVDRKPQNSGVSDEVIVYTARIFNDSADDLEINFYSFSGTVDKQIRVAQNFPTDSGSVATIAPNSKYSIPLKVACSNQVFLDMMINISGTVGSELLLFKILRDQEIITEDGQPLITDLVNPLNNTVNEDNTIIFLDQDVPPGKHIYEFQIINLGILPTTVNFFCFTADS